MNLSTGHWRQPNAWLDMSICIACYCQWWGFMFRVQEPQLLPSQRTSLIVKMGFLSVHDEGDKSITQEWHISRMEVMHLVQGWCQLVVVPSYIKSHLSISIKSFCWAITCEPYKFTLANSCVVNFTKMQLGLLPVYDISWLSSLSLFMNVHEIIKIG